MNMCHGALSYGHVLRHAGSGIPMDFTGISQDFEEFSANSQDFEEFPAISSQLPEMGGRGGGLNVRDLWISRGQARVTPGQL